MPPDLIERRISLVATIGAVVVFLLFALLAPAGFPSFDEWKYFGIGDNIWAGRGLTTVFGSEFLLHGPIWSRGRDAAARPVRRRLGGMGTHPQRPVGRHDRRAVGVVRVAHPTRGRRIRRDRHGRHAVPPRSEPNGAPRRPRGRVRAPLRGHRQSRRSGATRRVAAVGAGAVFAIGFLIKEIGLPVPPDPVLRVGPVGPVVGRDRADQRVDRADRSIGVAPWFALYASETGRAYRAETPAWTLIPVDARDRRARRDRADRRRHRRGRTRLRAWSAPNGSCVASWTIRLIVGLGGALRRAAAQLYAYSKTARLKGGPILTPQQLDLVRRHVDQAVLVRDPAAAIGLALSLVALAAYWRRAAAPADGRPDHRRDLRRAPGDLRGRGRGAAAQLPGPARARRAARGDRLDLGRRVGSSAAPGVDHRAAGDRGRARRRAFIGWRLRIDPAALVAIAVA